MFDMSARGFETGKSSGFNSFSYVNSRNSPTVKNEDNNFSQENMMHLIQEQIQAKIPARDLTKISENS